MTKPLIGITVEVRPSGNDRTRQIYSLSSNYAEEVARAGGNPILIAPDSDKQALAPLLDAVLIPGGYDIDSAHWNEDLHPHAELQEPERFASEKELFERLPPGVPVFGICYGCQFLNVIHGGSLTQHLPDLEGTAVHTGGPIQDYEVVPGTETARVLGAAKVNGKSYHHQAIDRVADGFRVTARHADGTIEAIESTTGRPMIAVQWHPERTPGTPESDGFFRALVEAGLRYRESQ